MQVKLRSLTALVGVCLALLLAPAAADERYPSRPITLIVPFPAGGGVDAVARIVADKLDRRVSASRS